MSRQLLLGGTAAIAIAAFTVGRATAPEPPPPPAIDHTVKQSGAFTVDVADVISTTIKDLKAQNRLQVFQYSGEARVSVSRKRFGGLLKGTQELSVPASVAYYIDLGKLTQANVKYNAEAKAVTVSLPNLTMGDVVFLPEKARTINGGLLTIDDQQVEELRRINYTTARKAFVAQAQNGPIKRMAEAQAKKNVETYFAIPLQVVGHRDVKVAASFGKNAI